MADLSYWELLRDPRWQRKRLEVMERDDFRCQSCGSREKTLNVHHGYYAKDRSPWEYESETLHTLCEECHKETQAVASEIKRLIGFLNAAHLLEVRGYIEAQVAYQNLQPLEARGTDIYGLADFLKIPVEDIQRQEGTVIPGESVRVMRNADQKPVPGVLSFVG